MQKWALRTKLQLEAAVKMGKVSNSEGHHLMCCSRQPGGKWGRNTWHSKCLRYAASYCIIHHKQHKWCNWTKNAMLSINHWEITQSTPYITCQGSSLAKSSSEGSLGGGTMIVKPTVYVLGYLFFALFFCDLSLSERLVQNWVPLMEE